MKDRIVAELPVRAGKREELEATLRGALPDTRGFDGCRDIEVFHDAASDTYVLIEEWDSFEHYDKYLAWRMETGLPDLLEPLLAGGAASLKITKLRATNI